MRQVGAGYRDGSLTSRYDAYTKTRTSIDARHSRGSRNTCSVDTYVFNSTALWITAQENFEPQLLQLKVKQEAAMTPFLQEAGGASSSRKPKPKLFFASIWRFSFFHDLQPVQHAVTAEASIAGEAITADCALRSRGRFRQSDMFGLAELRCVTAEQRRVKQDEGATCETEFSLYCSL